MQADVDWKELAATLRDAITSGDLAPGAALPSLSDLAVKHGVTRHTARKAISHLRDTGHVLSWQGRGSFVAETSVSYYIGSRTRFRINLNRAGRDSGTQLLDTGRVRAPDFVVKGLRLRSGATALRATLLREIEDRPAMFARHYYDPARFEGILDLLLAGHGVTEALAAYGIKDFTRSETIISTRLPRPTEAIELDIAATQPVLVTRGINVDKQGHEIEVSEAVSRGDKVLLVV
ncbi:UTRA domain-containing protein [Phaeobacter sp. J2-8]|uniref:GntR family transcriptional regulator n=1 Tax=Phaeobacter sp. J2-8 TaxID=2931394 RepID=UPI001FCFAA91|nr:UTRA domain-containing protein [Phaeobacter sp. J2-8]MCJ7874550.1 UTRA domain-containing protein [Phaeobacter sp. J2-8]